MDMEKKLSPESIDISLMWVFCICFIIIVLLIIYSYANLYENIIIYNF